LSLELSETPVVNAGDVIVGDIEGAAAVAA